MISNKIAHTKKNAIAKILRVFVPLWLVLSAFCIHCGSSIETNPLQIRTAHYALDNDTAAKEGKTCEVISSRRVVYVLFQLPLNEAYDKKTISSKGGNLAFKEVVTLGDAGLTLLGFLFGVLTRTVVVQECGNR